MDRYWQDGAWRDDPAGPTGERGLAHGLGCFETLRAVDGKVWFGARHLERLAATCRRWGWQDPPAGLAEEMQALAEAWCGQAEVVRVRVQFGAGAGPLDDISAGAPGRWWLRAQACPPEGEASLRVGLADWIHDSRSPLSGWKSTAYAASLIARDFARREGLDEILFLNERGELCEAAMANVFLLSAGVLQTPPLDSGCLPGVTRAVILEIAGMLGLPLEVRPLGRRELERCDGAFLTSAVRGPVAIGELCGRVLTSVELTRRLRHAWMAAGACKKPAGALVS